MTLQILDVEQGSEEWDAARRGILTASTIGKLITPKRVIPASNPESRAITMQLVAERITGYTEPTYATYEMEQGHWNEPIVREIYAAHTGSQVTIAGFMVRNEWGFRLGYSPDALVDNDGLLEIKSRGQKEQLTVITNGQVPDEHMAQLQTGLLVSGRNWIDYASYSPGMPLWIKRVTSNRKWQEAVLQVAAELETAAETIEDAYRRNTVGMPKTERINPLDVELHL